MHKGRYCCPVPVELNNTTWQSSLCFLLSLFAGITLGQRAERIVVMKNGWVEPLIDRVPGPNFLPSEQQQTHLTVKSSVDRPTKTAAALTRSSCGRLYLQHIYNILPGGNRHQRGVYIPNGAALGGRALWLLLLLPPGLRLPADDAAFARCGTSAWMKPHSSRRGGWALCWCAKSINYLGTLLLQ